MGLADGPRPRSPGHAEPPECRRRRSRKRCNLPSHAGPGSMPYQYTGKSGIIPFSPGFPRALCGPSPTQLPQPGDFLDVGRIAVCPSLREKAKEMSSLLFSPGLFMEIATIHPRRARLDLHGQTSAYTSRIEDIEREGTLKQTLVVGESIKKKGSLLPPPPPPSKRFATTCVFSSAARVAARPPLPLHKKPSNIKHAPQP
jgi:hypothetical protein